MGGAGEAPREAGEGGEAGAGIGEAGGLRELLEAQAKTLLALGQATARILETQEKQSEKLDKLLDAITQLNKLLEQQTRLLEQLAKTARQQHGESTHGESTEPEPETETQPEQEEPPAETQGETGGARTARGADPTTTRIRSRPEPLLGQTRHPRTRGSMPPRTQSQESTRATSPRLQAKENPHRTRLRNPRSKPNLGIGSEGPRRLALLSIFPCRLAAPSTPS